MTEEYLTDWKNFPCVLEVDLEYLEKLHDPHNDYPLAPERLEIKKKLEILFPTLEKKKEWHFKQEKS